VSKTGFTAIYEAEDFDEAVRIAAEKSEAGQIVLLSPPVPAGICLKTSRKEENALRKLFPA